MYVKSSRIGISGYISFRYNNVESNTKEVYKVSDLIPDKSVDFNKNNQYFIINQWRGQVSYDLGNRVK